MTSDRRPRPNIVKQAAASGARVRGVHLTFAAPTIIEVLASTSIDFVYLDGEHGLFEGRDIEACCIAAERHGLTVLARLPDRSAATVTRFLDRGVQGIVVPHVESAAEAEAVVEAVYFAPIGQRSYGGGRPDFGYGLETLPDHFDACNAAVSVCIMIESGAGLKAAGEIAKVAGVDYLSYGLNDLAQSLGHRGEPQHPEVQAAVAAASDRIRANGKRVREDFMTFAWINQVIVTGARQLLG